jgi:hypothetical protein
MKRPTFSETVDVLVKAYLNDTIEPGNYCGCAVGNLVANSLGIRFNHRGLEYSFGCRLTWDSQEHNAGDWYELLRLRRDYRTAKQQLSSTGYSINELILIERSFEQSSDRYNSLKSEDERMFSGLMGAVEVLADIHGIDLQTKESAKLLFVKA